MKGSNSRKLFILDTSVLLFDHHCIKKFKSHDIILPIEVLEELDTFKSGTSTKNFEAREVIRFLDSICKSESANDWIKIGENSGNLCIGVASPDALEALKTRAVDIFGKSKDNNIIDAASVAKVLNPDSTVILVTKDINLRIKARTLGITSEDYQSGRVDDLDKISKSSFIIKDVDHDIIEDIYKLGYSEKLDCIEGKKGPNNYFVLSSPTSSSTVLAKYTNEKEVGERLTRVEKKYASNIKPKNAEQTFALNSLLDPSIKLVALEGMAGTGKTLCALASALECRAEHKEIILARPLVSLSNNEIGFLPGDEKSKISPYMQPLYDNLKFIKSTYKPQSRKAKSLETLEEDGVLSIIALAFIRGRSISDTYFIIDEAQNLTPHEVKTIVTRAGENTKIVFTGDIHQIDAPYMDAKSNGLTYLIDKFSGEDLFSHIQLLKGERSALANLANKLL